MFSSPVTRANSPRWRRYWLSVFLAASAVAGTIFAPTAAAAAEGRFHIRSWVLWSGPACATDDGGPESWHAVYAWGCYAEDLMPQWRMEESGAGFYRLRNAGTGFCAAVDMPPGQTTTRGARIATTACRSGDPYQEFALRDYAQGFVEIVNRVEGFCWSQFTENPYAIVLDVCGGKHDQHYKFMRIGD